MNKRRYVMLLLSLCTALFTSSCNKEVLELPPVTQMPQVIETVPVLTVDKPDPLQLDPDQISIMAVGDVMVHESQWIAQSTGDDSYDFRDNFASIRDSIRSADLSVANLETTINDEKKVTTYPRFNSPDAILDALKDSGFNLISTANNHSMDTGLKGIFSTIDELEERDLPYIGTSKDSDAAKHTLMRVKDVELGIASFSTAYFNESGVIINNIRSMGMEDHVNYMELTDAERAFTRLKKEVTAMKSEGADFIILILHWGNEYEKSANAFQKVLAQLLIDEGVGLILGSHPHLVQEMEFLKSSDGTKEGLVVYSMGNFLSNQRNEILNMTGTEDGIIARVVLERNGKDEVVISKAQYIPTWVNRQVVEDSFTYEILPISKDPAATAEKFHAKVDEISESLRNTSSIMKDPRVTHLSLLD